MSWWPDGSWLKALDVRGSAAAAVFLACASIFALAEADVLYLGTLPAVVRAGLVAVAIVALALAGARAWDWVIETRRARRQAVEQEQKRRQHEATVLGYLDTLGPEERNVLEWFLEHNRQSFTAKLSAREFGTLLQKGLVVRGSGGYSRLEWPYTIPNFVWYELQRRRGQQGSAGTHSADATGQAQGVAGGRGGYPRA